MILLWVIRELEASISVRSSGSTTVRRPLSTSESKNIAQIHLGQFHSFNTTNRTTFPTCLLFLHRFHIDICLRCVGFYFDEVRIDSLDLFRLFRVLRRREPLGARGPHHDRDEGTIFRRWRLFSNRSFCAVRRAEKKSAEES